MLLIGIGGCHHGDGGPAWPKRADRASDGGESLAPHQSKSVASTSGDDDVTVDDKPAAEKPNAPTPLGIDAPKTPTATPIGDESLFGDDITIEIDD